MWVVALSLASPVAAQDPEWNDARTRALVERAVTRRTRQFADSGLRDYRARARGYLAFLGQFGEGFTEPPRAARVDELVVEVYWRAPDLSKQHLIGRRDTLLLPADIDYYRSRFGIIQNDFPNRIRMGDGRDVRDVPHPLSPAGLTLYDFSIADSLSLRLPTRSIDVYAVRIRPRDGQAPRVVGTAYVDRESAAVARLAFTFTRRALLDTRIETLSVVLENALVEARYWLPARQEVEVVRRVKWLDFPARGIIRARWTVCCYELNVGLDRQSFLGPEIVWAPVEDVQWTGGILEALPRDVNLLTDEDARQVISQAREIASAHALNRARGGALSAGRISDFVRFNRVEGLAVGAGGVLRLGGGVQLAASGRWGLADGSPKGRLAIERRPVGGGTWSLYATRALRDVGDVPETSLARNSISALFGDDGTDLYEVRAAGLSADFAATPELHIRLGASYEWHDRLSVEASPLTGQFRATPEAWSLHGPRASLAFVHPDGSGPWGSRVAWAVEMRGGVMAGWDTTLTDSPLRYARISLRGSLQRTFGDHELVIETLAAAVTGAPEVPPQELVLLGGVRTGAGYGFHEFAGTFGVSQRAEWRAPVPFVSIPLGRYGRTPATATLAPFAQAVYGDRPTATGGSRTGIYPSLGVGVEVFFDLLRFQVARGLREGRWTFSADLTRQLWSIF